MCLTHITKLKMDSEEEVVFRNSPLYNYLIENSICEYNIQSKEQTYGIEKSVLNQTKCHDDKIDAHVKTYLSVIFQSELLLKEDYETLQFIYSTIPLQTHTCSISKKLRMILTFSTFIMANQLKKMPYMHIMTAFIVPASYLCFQMYKNWKNKTNIENITLQTKIIMSKVRNLVKLLYDYDVLLVSSKRVNEQSCSNIKLNLFRQVFSDNIKNVIITFNNAVQKINLLIDVPLKDEIISVKNDIQSISTIYNLLLLSQSEFFLHVGYVLCTIPSNNQDIIFENILSVTQQELNSQVDKFMILYKNFLQVNFVAESNQFNIEKNVFFKEVHYSLRNICLLLHSMLTNSVDMLQSFEENNVEELSKNIIGKFCQSSELLESDLKILQSYLNVFQVNFKRSTNCNKKNDSINIKTETQDNLLKINFDDNEINYDEIFEAYVDSDIEQTLTKNYDESDLLKKSQVEVYKLLLNELQPILKNKKEEWEIREAKVQQKYPFINENVDTCVVKPLEMNPEIKSLENQTKIAIEEYSNGMSEVPNLSHIIKQVKKTNYKKRLPSKYEYLNKKKKIDKLKLPSEISTSINTSSMSEKQFAQILTQHQPLKFLQEDFISDSESNDK